MTLTDDEVYDALDDVEDPELGESIVSLEMVEEVEVDGEEVRVAVDLPNQSMQAGLEEAIEGAVGEAGASVVYVEWNTDEDEGDSELLPDVDKVIAVSSGKGGVGKSTFAVNLACALADDGAAVGILDADVYGPNLPRMFGESEPPRVTKSEQILPPEKYGVKVMSMGYLTGEDSPVVWRGAMVHKALTQLLDDVVWGELDYLVVDLPPGTGDAQLTIAQTVPVTAAVIVTTPQPVSVDDSRKGVEMFRQADVDVAGIVENMSEFACPDCGDVHDVFGAGGGAKLAQESDLPLLGEIPLDPDVRTGSDQGEPAVLSNDGPAGDAFAEAADVTRDRVDELAKRELPML